MNAALRFPLTDVKEKGESAVRANSGPEWFSDALSEGSLVGPVKVEGVIRALDDEASFEGSARGRWRFECSRCLASIEGDRAAPVEATSPIDAGPMDLTEEVRQSIALAQTMKMLCRPDCRGLCPVCQKNRNQTDCGHKTN